MPRKVDPGQITVGKGLAPEGTVEDSSFRYPERDVDPLRVHIHDPSRAHMASAIGIVDEADCYISDEVEGALQELCGGYSAGRLNGLIRGGLFDEVKAGLPTAGTTLTLESVTEIAIGAHVFDATGLVIVLPVVDTDYFVYCDTYSSSPNFRTLQYTTVAPPQVESDSPEIEQVMLAKITVLGGVITAYQDARFFVRNLDRKVLYSSRQGENVDAWSEGCFATLNAAMFWMEFYGDNGTSEEEKGTLLVRGVHELESTLVIPSEHVEFVGDGEGIIRAKAGFTGTALIEIPNTTNGGFVSFRNITFQTAVANLICISTTAFAGDVAEVRIDSCHIDLYSVGGTFRFDKGVVLQSSGPYGVSGFWMSNTTIIANITGLELQKAYKAEVLGCTFAGLGSSTPGYAGIWAHEGQGLVVSDCDIDNWNIGIFLSDSLTDVRIDSTRINQVSLGIQYDSGGIGTDILVSNCIIELDDDNAEAGIWMEDVKRVGVSNTHISSLRTTWPAAHNPYGIMVVPLTGDRLDLRITGCHVQGFLNRTDNTSGLGIAAVGALGTAEGITITGNTLVGNRLVVNEAEGITITGNSIDMGQNTGSSAATYPLLELRAVVNCTVSGNSVRGRGTATEGIYVSESSLSHVSTNVTITGNSVESVFTTGIEVEDEVTDFIVSNNTIDGHIGNDLLPTAALISVSNSLVTKDPPKRGVITGNIGRRAQNGILLRGVEANQGEDMVVSHNALNNIGNEANFVADSFAGSIGIGLEWYKNCTVHGNQVGKVGVLSFYTLALAYPRPILVVDCELVTIDSNQISGCVSVGVGNTVPVSVLTLTDTVGIQRDNFNITGNVLQTADTVGGDTYGIRFFVKRLVGDSLMTVRRIQITDNTVTNVAGVLGEAIRVEAGECGYIVDLTIRDNNLSYYLSVGIRLLAATGGSTTTQAIDAFRVCGNTLHGADPGNALNQSQIKLEGTTTGQADVRLVDGSISSNKIVGGFDQGITIAVTGTNVAKELILKNLLVTDNEISEMAISIGGTRSVGIYFNALGLRAAYPSDGIVNVQIRGNAMKNWLHSPILSHGLLWHSKGIPVSLLSFENNLMVGSGVASDPVIAYFHGDSSAESSLGDWTYISISGNEIIANASASVRDAVTIELLDTKLSHMKVLSNTFTATQNGVDEGRGLQFKLHYNSTPGNYVRDIQVNGNTMEGGVQFSSLGCSIKACQVSNNHITSISSSAGHNPVAFDLGGVGQTPGLENIQVHGNILIGGSTGCLIKPLDEVAYVKDVSIKDNCISGGFYSGVFFDASSATGVAAVQDISISGNQITDTPRGVMGVCYNNTVAGLIVCNNELRKLGEQGISLFLGGEAPGADAITNILVDGNNISNVTATSGDPTIEIGMHTPAPAQPGEAKNISVSRNTIARVGPVDNGVTFVSVDLAGWTNTHNVRICDNNLMGDPDDGDRMNTGIYVAVAPLNLNTHVDRNQIQSASRRGIQMASGGDSRLWSVSGNNITNITSSVFSGIFLNITGSDIVQWRVCDNVVRHVPASAALTSTEGIYLKQASVSGSWQQGSVCRNNVDQYGTGISLSADSPTAIMKEIAVDDNLIGGFVTVSGGVNVTDAMLYGIKIEATEFLFLIPTIPLVGESILGLSVSRNQVNSPAIGTGALVGTGIFVVGGLMSNSEVVRQVNVSDNKVYVTSTAYDTKSSGIVLYLLGENAISEIAVDRNQIRNTVEFGVFTIGRLAQDPSASCSVWSVSNNQVQSSSTFLHASVTNGDPYCNIGVSFPGVETNGALGIAGTNSVVKDVYVCGNNSVVSMAADHYNYYFGVSQNTQVTGPSLGWWVCDNSARGGTALNSVKTDHQSGWGTAFAILPSWDGQGEPIMKTVHDNRCEVTTTDGDWNGGQSWFGATGDNTHNNDNY